MYCISLFICAVEYRQWHLVLYGLSTVNCLLNLFLDDVSNVMKLCREKTLYKTCLDSKRRRTPCIRILGCCQGSVSQIGKTKADKYPVPKVTIHCKLHLSAARNYITSCFYQQAKLNETKLSQSHIKQEQELAYSFKLRSSAISAWYVLQGGHNETFSKLIV